MSYQSIHKMNETFLLTVLFVLIGLFLLTMAMMFVHPTGALLFFTVGLVFAGVAFVIERFIVMAEHAAKRREAR